MESKLSVRIELSTRKPIEKQKAMKKRPEKLTYSSKRDKRTVTMDLFKRELNAINYGQYSGTGKKTEKKKKKYIIFGGFK